MYSTRFKNISTAIRPLALVIAGLLVGGCGGGTMFALKDAGHQIKPTSVSVITGGSEEADLKLAEYLTKELKERTTLQVVEQSDVSKAIPSYPLTIKSVEERDGEVAWVDPSEKPKLDKIQTKLKTNYMFVIWSKGLTKTTTCSNQGGCTNTYSTNVYGNMLEYPAGKIVSHTAFNKRNSDSFLQLFRPKGYYVDELLKNSAEDIVDEFIKVTNTGKKK
ncbi:hypothetical protein [Nitrospira moscoviensis]|uniref:Lipoprotein n=1 Tax=Nitrospira moscoviensis TaxID=42253 RepID=A0A0K2GC08_NITMO|nr:hypothetical protein [Nitrospira moscoviensis]ALA58147.1 exported protein of unknown function [Nitrospira moscoviensis]